jgi:hypothetical protein
MEESHAVHRLRIGDRLRVGDLCCCRVHRRIRDWLSALLEKDVLQFARVACAYAPDSMPQRINEAVEDAGYTLQKLIELAKKRQH